MEKAGGSEKSAMKSMVPQEPQNKRFSRRK